ncbi:MAG: glycosyltransferase family protein [Geminicoccaceae bacterium]
MPVLLWVQHLLGSGHVKRALTLARAMAEDGLRVVVASGGMPAPWLGAAGVELVQLPPVRASDLTFAGLLDEHDRPVDDRFRAMRRDRLLALFRELRPRVVITEMFPFGRRAFRFELIPLLEAAAVARPRPWRLCSVRDVLVRKPNPEGYAWMLEQARAHYDRVLVHTDPRVIPFELTFPHAPALGERLIETGYVVGPPGPRTAKGRGEVLVSAGGGRVGAGLLEVAILARARSRLRERPWRLIAGGNLPGATFEKLDAGLPKGCILEHQREDFPALLANSLLSISQAGYNTVVEGLRFRRPMVLVPFETATETEQRTRAERLVELGLAEAVWESGLTPRRLAGAIDRACQRRPSEWPALALNGAERTARLVADWATASAAQDIARPEVAG